MRSTLPKLLILLAAAAGSAACSNSDDDPPDGIDGNADAGVSTGSADAGPGAGSTAIGLIIVSYGAAGTRGTAFFSELDVPTGPDACHTTSVGPCKVQSCPASVETDGQLTSAGTLTVSGGDQAVLLTPVAQLDGEYGVTSGEDAVFADGATITVHAEGSAVPAFTSPPLKMPEAIIVSGDMPSIDFTKDFPVSWVDGGPDGKVVVEILTDGGERTGHLSCSFDPTMHQAVVPKEALALLPDCPGDDDCTWLVQPESTVEFPAGPYDVGFTVIGDGETGTFQQHH